MRAGIYRKDREVERRDQEAVNYVLNPYAPPTRIVIELLIACQV